MSAQFYRGYEMTRDPKGAAGQKVTIKLAGKIIRRAASFTAAQRSIDALAKAAK